MDLCTGSKNARASYMANGTDPMKYLIDWLGRLWKGPGNPEDTLHYARFHGYMTVAPFNPIWVWERSDPPEDADEVDWDQALTAASLFWEFETFPRL